ncbi:MAG: FG-GAP-like repeat-containing protein [Ignavibacteriales bacterium]|nr:FG-GAP-like repeat-containing protein [Ignavibacteriales bacterium]HOJ08882.1 FG-GAP-like repeat-containing protein [Ignavibacteriaceae bacterium]
MIKKLQPLLLLFIMCYEIFYFNLYAQTFTDISESVGLPITSMGFQGAWFDYNNDGYPDIFCEDESRSYLFKNINGQSFIDITSDVGLNNLYVPSISVGDYDNDGYADLLIGRNVFRNINADSFQCVFILNEIVERSIWMDYNADGLLDIIAITNSSTIKIYKNTGNSNFIDVTSNFNLPVSNGSKTCSTADFDNDGYTDLYIGRYGNPNQLLKNIGGQEFYNLSVLNGFGDPGKTVSVAWGDYNNDGLADIYSANIGSARNYLYKNNGDQTFSDVTIAAGVQDVGDARTASFIDYNNDGLVDIFATNHVHVNRLYKNNGNGTFTDVASVSQIAGPGDGFGVSWADFDNDGDLDVIIIGHMGRRINLLRNDGGNNNNYIFIKLIGSCDNKMGIGAIVDIFYNGLFQRKQINSGEGNTGCNPATLHFGLNNANFLDSIIVKWPSGAKQIVRNLTVNQIFEIHQSQIPLPPVNLLAHTVTGETYVELIWLDNSTNEDGFIIERKAGDSASTSPFVQIATVEQNKLTFIDSTCVGDSTYGYRIYAFNSNGNSSYSNVAYVTAPIPIELVLFNCFTEGNKIILYWSTASETNNQGFEVERQAGNQHSGVWEKIGYVSGHGTTTEPRFYSFADENLSTGTYMYRLKQIDFDGSFEYSSEIEASIFSPKEFALNQNYPNPFNPNTRITFDLPVESAVTLQIFNSLGELIWQQEQSNLSAGSHSVTWDGKDNLGNSLTSGIYFLKMQANVNSSVNGDFYKSIKMMLLK